MGKIIKVQDVREAVVKALKDRYFDDSETQLDLAIDIMTEVYEMAEPEQKQLTGWWERVKGPDGAERFICSNCCSTSTALGKFCSTCGAKMGARE